jgi:DNA-binding CsgD family transcriptional regulator
MFSGRLSTGPGVREVAQAARSVPAASEPRDLLLSALATRFTQGYTASFSELSGALHAFAGGDDSRWLWLACRLSQDLWDDELWYELATRGVRVARETGALSTLPILANYRAALHVHAGAFDAASALIDEIDAITQATGIAPLKYASLMLAAWRGDPAPALDLFDRALLNATTRGEGFGVGTFGWATALLYNAGGRYEEALAAAQRACEYEDVIMFGWSLVELIEAAVRVDRVDVAAAALERLSARTQASGSEWALGIEAACRALVTDAEPLYRESVERLARSRGAVHLARAQLTYGEWLRREQRRREARELLRTAHESFSRIGAQAFAERAGRELLATGETARRITVDNRDTLTPQEAQVARLAREGHTNPEIGARLFISPRTVEYHLHKVFRKLDVTTRTELRRVLADDAVLGPA